MLELYNAVDQMASSSAIQQKAGSKNLQQMLRPILRDIAQSILVCYFNPGQDMASAAEGHRLMLAMLV